MMASILFATDLSKSTQNMLPYVSALAEIEDSSVLFMNVNNAANGHDPEAKLTELSKKFKSITTNTKSESRISVRSGGIPGEIIDSARSINADLIVMGANKKKSLMELISGSHTGHVIHSTRYPLILIPEGAKFRKINNMVFAADTATWNPEGFEKLVRIAQRMNASIMVLNLITGKTKETLHEAAKLVEKIRNSSKYPRVDFHFYRTDDVGRGIKEFISRYDIDLIALSHHKGKIEESVAQALAATTQIPLLIFPL